jgi:hypothetical protein
MDIAEKRRMAEAGSSVAQTTPGISYLCRESRDIPCSSEPRNHERQRFGIPQGAPEAVRQLEAVAKPSNSSDAFAARIELGRL